MSAKESQSGDILATDTIPVGALVRVADQPPTTLPAVLLEDTVPFPGPVVPVLLDSDARRDAVLDAKARAGYFILVNVNVGDRDEDEEIREEVDRSELVFDDEGDIELVERDAGDGAGVPSGASAIDHKDYGLGDLCPVGVLAKLVRVLQLPDGRPAALVQLVRRAQPVRLDVRGEFPIVEVFYPRETRVEDREHEAVFRQVKLNLQSFFEAHPQTLQEMMVSALAVENWGELADFVAQNLSRDRDERLAFLRELDVNSRLRRALEITLRELDLLTVGNRISEEIRSKVEGHQREFLLREQLRAIRRELGEEKDQVSLAIEELEQKLRDAKLPEHAQKRADEELTRLQMLSAESPEHNVVRSYLEWIAALPWSKLSEETVDLKEARRVLDRDHYGLEEVKERILEFLAVRKLKPDAAGSILLLSGPPGVGKTSLGRSIAEGLGREFFRFSVGGMRDESEIKGHRRTYIGAMPGRIIQGLRQSATRNPVFMIDEIDKMGSDWRGDPSSAMLEVLDPAQNKDFLDHYLDLNFDLSRVMFIATANMKTEIPGPLLDRMEVIDLPGYIPEEKLEIGMRYLVPRQRREHGLQAAHLKINRSAVRRVIAEYTHEAGVRDLERQVGKVARKRAKKLVEGEKKTVSVTANTVPDWLGPPRIQEERVSRKPKPGVAVGLAWTQVGGDILFIEAATMPGKGTIKLTGQLGEVMSESATLAMSYVRTHMEQLGIDPEAFKDRDFHIHFPAGAVKKDGPSAGITITTALISLLSNVPIRARLAMTGEMTLRGDVLPVGGIREKVVAARRAGVRVVILPERNRADIEEIPADIRAKLEVVFASSYEDVLRKAFDGSFDKFGGGEKGARRNEKKKTHRDSESRRGRRKQGSARPNRRAARER